MTNSALAEAAGKSIAPVNPVFRFVRYDKPFNFSEKCNLGATAASGARLIFLNDDVESGQPDWIQNLIEPLENPADRRGCAQATLRDRKNSARRPGHGRARAGRHRLPSMARRFDRLHEFRAIDARRFRSVRRVSGHAARQIFSRSANLMPSTRRSRIQISIFVSKSARPECAAFTRRL